MSYAGAREEFEPLLGELELLSLLLVESVKDVITAEG